jgi:hypothetical protein
VGLRRQGHRVQVHHSEYNTELYCIPSIFRCGGERRVNCVGIVRDRSIVASCSSAAVLSVSSSPNLQLIRDALDTYAEQMKIDLKDNPFAEELKVVTLPRPSFSYSKRIGMSSRSIGTRIGSSSIASTLLSNSFTPSLKFLVRQLVW